MKYVALTFSDEKYIKTRARYVAEMESKNIFSEIFSYGPEDLDVQFLKNHGEFILKNPRGYGYWIWKPYLILKVLRQLKDGDILVYGDAGCEMKGTREECLQKFDLVKNICNGTKIIANHSFRNYLYIKTDLYFRVRWYAIIFAPKIMAATGRIVIEKNDKTVKFVKEWLHFCTNDYRNIDDSPSILPKIPRFREHRHDQSVFSLLFGLYKCKLVDFENIWPASRLKF
jgi:hypothetical protein